MITDFYEIFNEWEEFLNRWDEAVNKNQKKEENKDDKEKCHSYCHCVSDKYENGEHISHKEKEIKDGKVIKDIEDTKNIESKKEEQKKSEIETLKEEIARLLKHNKELSQINNQLQHEKRELEIKLSKIKSMF